jgi:N-methylhydantoinase A
MTYRIATDVGGTFTDAVLLDEASGDVKFEKVPTTSSDFSQGTMNAVDGFEVSLGEATFFVHGTTVAINILIEEKGAKTGLITTRGFRDVAEIGRSNRPNMYDPLYQKPKPLIERSLRLEVDERVSYDGGIIKPLNEIHVNEAIKKFKENAVQSVAVCLFNSYANPIHEIRIGQILKEFFPEASVSLSHLITREYREYERTSTTILNSYVMPIVERYLRNMEQRLIRRVFTHDLLIMQSNGGMMTSTTAMQQPVNMVESGPASGAIGAAVLGKSIGYLNLISYDMGGTTAKTALIENGAPRTTLEYKIKGNPLRIPIIDLQEVGAGGGSIAWIDSAGGLHVGPKSAGAEPGPACYGIGGVEPTVTDANLLLGRLNPKYFLGGRMKIYPDLAKVAVQKIAEFYQMDLTDAAHGIIKIVNANMAELLRAMTIRRGYDPRDFVAVGFGGAGPGHIGALARELKISKMVIPPVPGNFSAWGMLMTDLRHDFIQTFVKPISEAETEQVNEMYLALEKQGTEVLKHEGVSESNIQLVRAIDIRYLGQEHTLTTPISGGIITEDEKELVCKRFDELHERTYRHSAPQEPKEIVNLRLVAIGAVKKPFLRKIKTGQEKPPIDAIKEKRPVYFEEEGFVDCQICERERLLSGNIIDGPAVIEEPTSTTLIHPTQKLTVDLYGNLIISLEGD